MSDDNDESCCCFVFLITATLFIIAASGIDVIFLLCVTFLLSCLILICFHCIRCIKADIDNCYTVQTPVYYSDEETDYDSEEEPDYESEEEDKEIDYVIVVNPDHISIAVEVVN